jgi:hypothetical protein
MLTSPSLSEAILNDFQVTRYYCGQKLTELMVVLLPLQERTMERRPEAGAQPFPTWAWQTQGSPHMPLHHSAASSGFSTAVGGANGGGGGGLPSLPPAPSFPNYQFFS